MEGTAFPVRIQTAGTLACLGDASCPLCLGILFLVTAALGLQEEDTVGSFPPWELFKAEHFGEGKRETLVFPIRGYHFLLLMKASTYCFLQGAGYLQSIKVTPHLVAEKKSKE